MSIKRPIVVVRKTSTDLSLFLIIPIMPMINANTPEAPIKIPGIAKKRLLKKVSPPRWPIIIKDCNMMNRRKKEIIKAIDNLPRRVFALKYTFNVNPLINK